MVDFDDLFGNSTSSDQQIRVLTVLTKKFMNLVLQVAECVDQLDLKLTALEQNMSNIQGGSSQSITPGIAAAPLPPPSAAPVAPIATTAPPTPPGSGAPPPPGGSLSPATPSTSSPPPPPGGSAPSAPSSSGLPPLPGSGGSLPSFPSQSPQGSSGPPAAAGAPPGGGGYQSSWQPPGGITKAPPPRTSAPPPTSGLGLQSQLKNELAEAFKRIRKTIDDEE